MGTHLDFFYLSEESCFPACLCYGVPTNIDLFIKLLKYESEVNALGFVDERQMFEDVVKKEMLFEHSQKKTNSLLESLWNRVSKCEMTIERNRRFVSTDKNNNNETNNSFLLDIEN